MLLLLFFDWLVFEWVFLCTFNTQRPVTISVNLHLTTEVQVGVVWKKLNSQWNGRNDFFFGLSLILIHSPVRFSFHEMGFQWTYSHDQGYTNADANFSSFHWTFFLKSNWKTNSMIWFFCSTWNLFWNSKWNYIMKLMINLSIMLFVCLLGKMA